MKKLVSFALAGICMVYSPTVFAQDGQAKFLEFKKYNDNYDQANMDKSINELGNNYSYFKPTGQDVSVRSGPGINYSKFGKLMQTVTKGTAGENRLDFSNLQYIGVDSYFLPWVGGIVSNKVLPGDENCSGWQEIVMLEMTWLAWDAGNEYPDYSGLDMNTRAPYVCRDYIKTSPIKEKDKNNFAQAHYNTSPIMQGNLTTSFLVKEGMEIKSIYSDVGNYVSKKGEVLTIFDIEPSKDSLKNEHTVEVIMLVDSTQQKDIGRVPFNNLMNLVSDDAQSVKDMQDYIERNSKKFQQ